LSDCLDTAEAEGGRGALITISSLLARCTRSTRFQSFSFISGGQPAPWIAGSPTTDSSCYQGNFLAPLARCVEAGPKVSNYSEVER
jgi:hypothetical protein